MFEKIMVGIVFASLVIAGFCGLWVAGCETWREAALPIVGMLTFGSVGVYIANAYEWSYDDEE